MPPGPTVANLTALGAWADRLACPGCLKPVRVEAMCLVCTGCGRTYPIVDGIPVLIPDPGDDPDPNASVAGRR
jgi:uncharacterized protein